MRNLAQVEAAIRVAASLGVVIHFQPIIGPYPDENIFLFPQIRPKDTLQPQTHRHRPGLQACLPLLRRKLVSAVYDLLLKNGFALSSLGPLMADRPQLENGFSARARNFFQTFFEKQVLQESQLDSRTFARLIGYTLATDNAAGHDGIGNHIDHLCRHHPQSGDDLVKYFYHVRGIAAYLYNCRKPMLSQLAFLGQKILDLDDEIIEERANFVLLWLKNIALAAQAVFAEQPLPCVKDFHRFPVESQKQRLSAAFSRNGLVIPRTLPNQGFIPFLR